MTPPPIRLEDLALAHGRQVAVEHLSGSFPPGSLTAVVGPNGAGKTTLLRALAGLHRPSAGRIDLGGLDRASVALLPQVTTLDRSFPIACLEVIALGHWARLGPFRGLAREQVAAARAALATVGLAGFEARQVGALSAGQFQRVLFARLIVQDAPVLLLDEPFSAVDEATEADLMRLVARWHAEGRTVIAVLHDFDLVRAAFPETLKLAGRRIAWGATATVLTPESLPPRARRSAA